ncbi:MAG: hypothetical protein ACFFB3_02970 [Candidatus Hodarchaeota archaeon]
MEIIGQDILESHLRALADNGLISPQEASDVSQRLKKIYQDKTERFAPSKKIESKQVVPSALLSHFHASCYIKNIIKRRIDETNLVIDTFVDLWNASQIGDEESRIAIEKSVERKKELERLYEIAQKRNKLDFEDHITRIDTFSQEIDEIEKKEDQTRLKERSETIRASIRESLEFLAKTNLELDSYIQLFNKLLITAQSRMAKEEADPARFMRIIKRLETLVEVVRGHHLTIQTILSKQSQYEFETVLAKEVVTEDHEREILISLVAQLQDAGKIPALFNQKDIISEMLSSLEQTDSSSQEEAEITPDITLNSQSTGAAPSSEDLEQEEESIVPAHDEPSPRPSAQEKESQNLINDGTTGPWSLAGKILLASTNQPIGICTDPITTSSGEIYLKCIKEEDISLEESDQIYREMAMILKGASDTSNARKEALREEITDNLKIPAQLALKPTFVREYFAKKHVVALKLPIELGLTIKTIENYPYELLVSENDKKTVKLISGSAVKNIEGNLVPSVWAKEIPPQGVPIKRFDGYNLGIVRNLIATTSFGTFIVSEWDRPSSDLCTEIHQNIGGSSESFSKSPGIWSLRFLIARRLDGVFEGEALLPWNVWRFLWDEKIPILPWDLKMDYVRLIPAGAIARADKSEIHLKRRLEPHPIATMIPIPENSIVFLDGRNLGRFVGYDLDEKGIPGILVACRSTGEILASVGRDTSENYIRRLGARISKALGIPVEQAMSPGAIVRYLLFFVRVVDVSTFTEAMNWLREHLDLQFFPLNQIDRIEDTITHVISEE